MLHHIFSSSLVDPAHIVVTCLAALLVLIGVFLRQRFLQIDLKGSFYVSRFKFVNYFMYFCAVLAVIQCTVDAIAIP